MAVVVVLVLLNFILFHTTLCGRILDTSLSTELYHAAFLDADENFHLSWDFDEDKIIFEVNVRTLGYFGLGISPNGGMKDSDITIGGFRSGIPYIQDRYATGHSEPKLDESGDCHLISGSENNTHTTVRFWRKLYICDEEDRPIKSETVRVIWAYHRDDWQDASSRYHGTQRGSKSLFLLNPQRVIPDLPEDSFTVDFINSNHNVPSDHTTYWCQAFTLESLKMKHHAIKFDPIIQPGNEGLVHHIVFSACDGSVSNQTAGLADDCFDATMWSGCVMTIYAWAVGGGSFYFPEHVGYPFGLDDDPTLFILQTHYDNPTMRSDFMDASGVRMTLTPTIRKYDAGTLTTGVMSLPTLLIPPFAETFKLNGYCTADCLEQGMVNETGINVFAAFLHAHLLGRAIKFRHIRNGVEQRPIMVDDNYDFNFQETRVVEPEIQVQKAGWPTVPCLGKVILQKASFSYRNVITPNPRNLLAQGDSLITECTYSSAHKEDVTFGGESTRNEMCVTFVLYYPRIPLTNCLSQIPVAEWATAADVTLYDGWWNYTISEPEELRGVSLFSVLANKTDWSNEEVRARAQSISWSNKSPNNLLCMKDALKYFEANGKRFIPRRVDQKWIEADSTCMAGATSITLNSQTFAGIVLSVLTIWIK